MFSRADSDGIRLNAWNTKPTWSRRYDASLLTPSPDTSMSPSRIDPDVGVRMPPRHDSRVVLPHPDGPSNTTSSPGAASNERPSSGRTAYPSWTNSTTRSRTCKSVISASRSGERERRVRARHSSHAGQTGEECHHDGEHRKLPERSRGHAHLQWEGRREEELQDRGDGDGRQGDDHRLEREA